MAFLTAACSKQVPLQTTFEKELIRRSGEGVRASALRERKRTGFKPFLRDKKKFGYVIAFCPGPKSSLGSVEIYGATIQRILVFDLRATVNADVEGITISALISAKQWPDELVLKYEDRRDYKVVLTKDDDGLPETIDTYWHFPAEFKLGKRRLGKVKCIASVNKMISGKKLVGVEREEQGTIYYYLNEE